MNEKTSAPSAADLKAPVAAPVAKTAELPAEIATANWGAIEAIESTDLIVPKIFHQQATSQFVKDDLARAGDFCDSLTGEVLSERKTPLEVIIFGAYKTMVVKTKQGDKYNYDSTIYVTPKNAAEVAAKPFFETVNGIEYSNSLQYNFYCLIPGKGFPYVLTLGGTKTQAAKKINTMISKLGQIGRPGASVVFELHNFEDKNDKGTWWGLEVKQGRDATSEELASAYEWHMKSKSQKFVVEEEDLDVPF